MLLAICHTAFATEPDIQISVAEIAGYGIFETRSSAKHSGFTRRAVAADAVTGVRFTEFTKEIPARQGLNFGFEYTINSTPRGGKIPIRSIIRFPEPGLQEPSGKHYLESVEHKSVTIGERSLHGYGFDESWEVLPGKWVFEIWYKEARLIKQTFDVVPEMVVPEMVVPGAVVPDAVVPDAVVTEQAD